MTVNKRKKNSRQRASHTHGWGSMKKHRGSGHKGGVGMSGTGKRADSKKPSIWKTDYWGKKGFHTRGIIQKTVNVSFIEEHIKDFEAKDEGGKLTIDLTNLGYDKLLGKGKTTKKMLIKVNSATEGAIESVKQAGGEVHMPAKKAVAKPKPAEKPKVEQ